MYSSSSFQQLALKVVSHLVFLELYLRRELCNEHFVLSATGVLQKNSKNLPNSDVYALCLTILGQLFDCVKEAN